MIEICLKFEKPHDANSICNISSEQSNLNILELSHKTLDDLSSTNLHSCVADLLQQAMAAKPREDSLNTNSNYATPDTEKTFAIVHQEDDNDLNVSSKRSSIHYSMETILDKKDMSPEKLRLNKSVNHLDEYTAEECAKNCESVELIFISDEFVNNAEKQKEEVVVLDEREGKRRDSFAKIIVITDEYKHKVLRNNSIVIDAKKVKKLKKVQTINTLSNSYLVYDEPLNKMETKPVNGNWVSWIYFVQFKHF